MTPDNILGRAPNAVFEVVAGETMLIDLNTGAYFSLNKVGTEFWQRLDGRQTLAEHAAALAAAYDVGLERVVNDLVRLADKLAAENLVISQG